VRGLTINVDIDGVLGDFHSEMVNRMNAHMGKSLTKADWSSWDPSEAWGLPNGVWTSLFQSAVVEGIFEIEPVIAGAVRGIDKLMAADHRIRIVTSKILWTAAFTHRAMFDTIKWMVRNGIPNDVELVFTSNTHHKTDYQADVVIDDQPNLETWCQDHGALNIIYDQPWNQEAISPYVIRAQNWDEVVWAIGRWAVTGLVPRL